MLDQDNNFYLMIHLSVSKLQSPFQQPLDVHPCWGGGEEREREREREERCEELEFCLAGVGFEPEVSSLAKKI